MLGWYLHLHSRRHLTHVPLSLGRQLTPVDALVTKTGRVYVLAMLTQREEGRYYLEDLSGGVEMDVSRVVRASVGACLVHCHALTADSGVPRKRIWAS